jgi:hypothetical protein
MAMSSFPPSSGRDTLGRCDDGPRVDPRTSEERDESVSAGLGEDSSGGSGTRGDHDHEARPAPAPDRPMFVQFLHPGSEHRPTGPLMEWNRGPHARKFLKASGLYVDKGAVRTGAFLFWGEWEPQSRILETYQSEGRGGPHWLHDPYWDVPRHRRLLQNTDPLVFGEYFRYSNCRQGRNAKLRLLLPGSVILFGSRIGPAFVLDTVFVVGADGQDYSRGQSGLVACPDWIQAVVFEPLRSSHERPTETFRLYRGRTYEEAPDGGFSFVPCRPYGAEPAVFPRPAIHLDRHWLEPNLAMGAKATPASDAELRVLWEEVVEQVVAAGLSLGIRLAPPPGSRRRGT